MNLRMGNEADKEYILNVRPQAAPLFEGRSYYVVAEDDGILSFAVVFHRDIEAPVPANEAFINLIEVLEESNHKKGIASCLVQKIIEMEQEKKHIRYAPTVISTMLHLIACGLRMASESHLPKRLTARF